MQIHFLGQCQACCHFTKCPGNTEVSHHLPQPTDPRELFKKDCIMSQGWLLATESAPVGRLLLEKPPAMYREGLTAQARRVLPVMPCKLCGACSQGVTKVGHMEFTRPMWSQTWSCGGGFNIGKMAPSCELHMMCATHRNNGGCSSSPCTKSYNSVFPCRSLELLPLLWN